MKSKVLALSAISAGLQAVFLTVGAYVMEADLLCLVIASAFSTLPFYYNSYKGSILSFLAGTVIAFLFSGFNILSLVFPCYLGFFGIFPIVLSKLKEKKLNKYLILFIGLIWCVAVFYGSYFYYTLVMKGVLEGFPSWLSWIKDFILVVVGVLGVVFYFVYERFLYSIKIFMNKYLGKIIK